MEYTKKPYIKMIKTFNEKEFKQKLELLRDHQDVLSLNYDNGWTQIEFVGMDEETKEEIEEIIWFEWDAECFASSSNMWDLMSMAGIV